MTTLLRRLVIMLFDWWDSKTDLGKQWMEDNQRPMSCNTIEQRVKDMVLDMCAKMLACIVVMVAIHTDYDSLAMALPTQGTVELR